MEPTILHLDNHLIAVWKPPGLLTQGDRSGQPNLLDEVKAWLGRTYHKPGNVFLGLLHRLDRQVAGVVLFARTSKAASRLSEQFRERKVEKIYWALVQGRLAPPAGELTHYIDPQPDRPSVVAYTVPGAGRQLARLRYRTLREARDVSAIELVLETGRKHQIRAQLAATAHPILGDVQYRATRAWEGDGIALVAKRLVVSHPISKQSLAIEVPAELCPFRNWFER
ncbi:MAG TPA: RNA pseudouridine synthase [Polyangiales bacterium]|nr:RNA pseudouridine synthase [Polyangiales bacterium]